LQVARANSSNLEKPITRLNIRTRDVCRSAGFGKARRRITPLFKT
jgi:hypothetical protein